MKTRNRPKVTRLNGYAIGRYIVGPLIAVLLVLVILGGIALVGRGIGNLMGWW